MFHIGIAVQHPPLPDPSELSELGIDFIRQCLTIDPEARPSAAELILHPWISQAMDQLNAMNDLESPPPSTASVSGGSSRHGSLGSSGGGSFGAGVTIGTAPHAATTVLEEEEEDEYEDYGEQGRDMIREEEEEGREEALGEAREFEQANA